MNNYDKAWKVLKRASSEFRAAGIPDHEVPPAMADFLIMLVLALGKGQGLSVMAAQAIIERMEQTVEDFRAGNAPFGSPESVKTTSRKSKPSSAKKKRKRS